MDPRIDTHRPEQPHAACLENRTCHNARFQALMAFACAAGPPAPAAREWSGSGAGARGDRGGSPSVRRKAAVSRKVSALAAVGCRPRRGEFPRHGASLALWHGQPSVTRQLSARAMQPTPPSSIIVLACGLYTYVDSNVKRSRTPGEMSRPNNSRNSRRALDEAPGPVRRYRLALWRASRPCGV